MNQLVGAIRGDALLKIDRAASLLNETQLFGELDPDSVERLADRAVERTYKKGQLIFHEGDPGDSLYVVAAGMVKVFVTSEEGEEMVLVTLRSPEIFGEVALLDGGQRSASAEALESTTLLILTRPVFLEVLKGSSTLTEALLRSLGGLVRRLTEQTSDLVFLDLYGRVAKLIVTFAQTRGEEAGEGVILDLQLTQTDIAAMVGGSRQSVNQILRAFERRGYLEVQGRRIILKKADQLRRRAGM